jgi:hypothetical protein
MSLVMKAHCRSLEHAALFGFPPCRLLLRARSKRYPKAFLPSLTSPPSCQRPLKFSAFRSAREYVRKSAMIKSSNALRHHIVFRTIVQIYLGGSQWQASGLNGPDHLFDQERMIAMAWRHTLRFVVCQLLNQTKITIGHPLSLVMRASVWQAKSSLCTMVPFRPIPIARA